MKTIFIFDRIFTDFPISFFTLDGNYSHLDNIYIDASDASDKVSELVELLYDYNNNYKVNLLHKFPVSDFNPQSDKVIVVGYV